MLSQEQIQQFARLDDHYRNNINPHLDNDSPNLRSACGLVRSFATGHSAQTATNVADALIMPAHTTIAFVNGAIDVTWRRLHIDATSAVFSDIVKEMATESLSERRISRSRFLTWREAFFRAAQYRANQCFNRFLFACFPQQFCSVVSPARLRAVMKELVNQGLLDDFQVTTNDDAEWFDLCQLVVPVVQEAFPTRDYADHSTFLAAMGEALTKK